jgi:hypothetical protein
MAADRVGRDVQQSSDGPARGDVRPAMIDFNGRVDAGLSRWRWGYWDWVRVVLLMLGWWWKRTPSPSDAMAVGISQNGEVDKAGQSRRHQKVVATTVTVTATGEIHEQLSEEVENHELSIQIHPPRA